MPSLLSSFHKTSVKANLVANFLGRFVQAFCTFFFIPFYITFIGVESYGLMAIYSALQVVLSFFDLGLSSALNRELASNLENPEKVETNRDLVRSLEFIFWGIGISVCIASITMAPKIAGWWLLSETLSQETIETTVLLIGLVVGIQFPTTLYSGGLLGLQRQIPLNSITGSFAVIKGVGAIFALWKISPTVEAFWVWQVIVGVVQTGLLRWFLWKFLPQSVVPSRFNWKIVKKIWRFAAGLAGINLLAVILTQVDKVILSKLLTLEEFGYYTLATTASSALFLFIQPFFTAVFPRFSQLVAEKKEAALKGLYHDACQTLSVLIFPIAFILSLFSSELLLLWTHNPEIAAHGSKVLSLHVVGTTFNGLMNIPYALQLAHGWTSLTFFLNLTSAIILVPLIIFLTQKYQLMGAAMGWVILNTIYVTFGVQIMHRKLLTSEKWRWYFFDVLFPALGAGFPIFLLRSVVFANDSMWILGGKLASIWFISLVCSSLFCRFIREKFWFRLFRKPKGSISS